LIFIVFFLNLGDAKDDEREEEEEEDAEGKPEGGGKLSSDC